MSGEINKNERIECCRTLYSNSQTIMGRFHPQIQKEDTTCAYGLTFNRSLWANGACLYLNSTPYFIYLGYCTPSPSFPEAITCLGWRNLFCFFINHSIEISIKGDGVCLCIASLCWQLKIELKLLLKGL